MAQSNIKKNNKIKNFVGVIIIGAIGSGLWDVFLKGIVFKLGGLFVRILSYFNKGYIDHLYTNVGSGSIIEFIPSLLIILIIISLPILFIIRVSKFYYKPETNNLINLSISERIINYLFKTKKRAYTIILIIGIPISFMYADLLIKDYSTIKACRYIDRNIEIIRPYINDSNFIQLRSKFRQIDNKSKLVETLSLINNIAVMNKIYLSQCNLYGVNFTNN